MHRFFTKSLTITYAFMMFFFAVAPLFSQGQITEEITEGKEYWFGLPFCGREQNEAIRGAYPIEIWISSKVDTRATVSDAETNTPINVNIRKNKITVVPYGDIVMMKESEIAKNYGIHVTADDPVSIAVYMSYRWSGEAYRVIPVEWLGRKYVTLNMYQDQLTQAGEYRPPQILIVATDDNTKVNYRPTSETVKGVLAGQLGSVMLNKGQAFLILGSTKPGLTQQDVTDLTGTYIDASKPVAVISGHTKAAFPRYQYTFLGRNGGFMRNMMTDMMWPIELLGKEYISAPIKYADRVRNQIQDDIGDLIRFVATEDNTVISQMRQDGSGFMKISPTLKKGQFYDIVNQELAAFYSATAPVLVGQYGKTWWIHAVTPLAEKGNDQGQNPSRNGQGMLITLAPVDHWTSYATWRSPEQIDDFIYVTFEADKLNYLTIDGTKFSVRFGNAIKYINGTKYAYIAEPISAGDHYIEGDTLPGGKIKATYAAYAYGNWDRSKDGFAYGYPIGINYNSPCEDSLVVKDTMICGNVTGNAFVLPPNVDCAAIFNVLAYSSTMENYEFVLDPAFKPGAKTAKWSVNILDPKKYAYCKIRVLTKSGKSIARTYEYFPEEIKVEPTLVDFGLLKEKDVVKGKFIKITNIGKVPMTIKNLKLKNNRAEFEIKMTPADYPFTLQPNDFKNVEVWAKADTLSKLPVRDWVIAELTCYDSTLTQLVYIMGDIKVKIYDAHWDPQPVGSETPQTVKIVNTSDVDVELYSMSWPDADKAIFTKVEGLTFPIKLKARDQMEFTVYYKPNKITPKGQKDTTTALFIGNTQKDKLWSGWDGTAIEAGPQIIGYDWDKRRIVDGKWVTTSYPYHIEIKSTQGTNTKLNVNKVWIENDPDGVFTIDQSRVPTQIDPDIPVEIPATFNPKAEKIYISTVKFEAEFNNKVSTVEAQLRGVGIQPHVAITGKEFLPAIKVGTSTNDFASVSQPNPNPGFDMEVTVTKLTITGPDAAAFTIDPQFLNPSPSKVIQPDQNWQLPVKFTAMHPGVHNAQITPEHDAPDVVVADLIGHGYDEGLQTSDYDYKTIFKSLSKDGQVYLINKGTDPVTIMKNIDQSIDGDINAFNLGSMTWKTSISNQVKPLAPFTLAAGETLFVDVKFTALDVKTFRSKITYEVVNTADTSKTVQKAYSNLIGAGKVIKTVAKVPTGYNAKPGDALTIEYRIEKAPGETQAIETASIHEIKALINFKSAGTLNVQDVYPRVKGPQDIIQAGTLSEGWTIDEATIINQGMTLMVKMHNENDVLKGDGPLFKFTMSTFLSDLDQIPLPCEFMVYREPANYTLIDTIPGSIVVEPVCVNTLRLIILSGTEYSLMQNEPNPVTDKTIIRYSVGLEAPTSLELFSTAGEKVATLINQNLKPGTYEITLDTKQLGLPSGTYYYKIVSGPYTETKGMNITK